MEFIPFADKVRKQFDKIAKHDLYRVNLTKDEMWTTYLEAFPEGTNPIYLERTEHDCQTCRNFIKGVGNVVAIINDKIVSVWDVTSNDDYDIVAKAMSDLVHSRLILEPLLSSEKKAGAMQTKQFFENSSDIKTWNHFSCELPAKYVTDEIPTKLGKISATKQVFTRGLEETTLDAFDTVLDLIAQKSLYKGDEHVTKIAEFRAFKVAYDKIKTDVKKNIFIWKNIKSPAARFRNTVIGTLITDLSQGVELEIAVKSFETKVAPENYKRTTALVTPGMIKTAVAKIEELSIEPSLKRRFAEVEDITINNVLFADKETSALMKSELTDLLMTDVRKNVSSKTLDKIEDISIDKFVTDVLPNVDSMEVFVENKQAGNFVSLLAPIDEDAPGILAWKNNFSWSYEGNITDSMKERVKAAGGDITGVLRFSIQWNEDKQDGSNDLDAHCEGPTGHLYYSHKRDGCTGVLDVDITRPISQTKDGIAVENITWQDLRKMKDGKYKFYVKNYSGTNTKGFRAQVEFNGQVFSYDYPTRVSGNVQVAEVTLKNGEFTINHKLSSEQSSQDIWNVKTQDFHKVSTMMLSPNYWDDNKVGNKHWFFMLDGCKTDVPARGLYNEFLKPSLMEHRKVFDVLGGKMQCQPTDKQLSGLGFSSTKRAELIVKVKGNFTRTLKIKF